MLVYMNGSGTHPIPTLASRIPSSTSPSTAELIFRKSSLYIIFGPCYSLSSMLSVVFISN